jgi:hypothetical protein
VKEWTLSAGTQIGANGHFKATYAHRSVSDFVEDFTTFDLGTVEVTTPSTCLGCEGPFLLDRSVYRNSNLPRRDYQALQLITGYRVSTRWNMQANYTYQIKNEGNFEGENPNQPAVSSDLGDYPEILVPGRNFPEGRLNDYQKHKVRAWTTYDLGLGWLGNLNLGLLYRYDSALTYSLVAQNQSPSDIQLARDPGYAQPPGPTLNVFFGERGVGEYKGVSLFDLAATYDIKTFKKLRPYVKFDMRNIFNNKTLGAGTNGFNTTVQPDENGPVDADGIPLNYVQGPNFGKATGNLSYPFPREFRIALGIRF